MTLVSTAPHQPYLVSVLLLDSTRCRFNLMQARLHNCLVWRWLQHWRWLDRTDMELWAWESMSAGCYITRLAQLWRRPLQIVFGSPLIIAGDVDQCLRFNSRVIGSVKSNLILRLYHHNTVGHITPLFTLLARLSSQGTAPNLGRWWTMIVWGGHNPIQI